MTVTIWPHGWNFQTFLLGVAVFTVAALAGGGVGVSMYTWGFNDAKAVYAPHHAPHHPIQQGGRTP
jgi:hypothetical protein